MGSYVRAERQNAIGIITLDRPPVNALNVALLRELASTLEELTGAEGLRVVVLHGAGPKAFAAGADISDFPRLGGPSTIPYLEETSRLINAVEAFPLPVIAALHGYCLGGGCELALACDLRVGAENLRIGLPEITLGLVPGAGGTQRLPRLVPAGTARRLAYTGMCLTASEALGCGLIDEATEGSDPLPRALEIAALIARQPASALMAAKELLRAAQSLPLGEGLRLESSVFLRCLTSEQGREGVKAFLEKREPAWRSQGG